MAIFNLGTLTNTINRRETVSQSDPIDVFQFSTKSLGNINVALTDISANVNVDLSLYRDNNNNGIVDASDTFISNSIRAGNADESINVANQPAGNYIIQASPFSPVDNASYSLLLSADNPSNLLPAEFQLGDLEGDRTFINQVGNNNTVDIYAFSIESLENVNINLAGLTSDADIRLIRDSNFNRIVDSNEVILSSTVSGTSSESISLNTPSSYYLQVYQLSGDTNYTLTFDYSPSFDIIRLSVDSNGIQGNRSSGPSSISADGRYVAFTSSASNLVANDTNNSSDVFVRDTVNNTTTLVSVDSNGIQGNGSSGSSSISADGRYVAFTSRASNLVPNNTNRILNNLGVLVRDTVNNTTTLVSVDSNGIQGNEDSFMLSISADGQYVAFQSSANNLVPNDTNGNSDIFVRDTVNNTTTRVSVDSNGIQGNGISNSPSISADGRYVAFSSFSTNLVLNDTNGRLNDDIFVRDIINNTTTLVSVDSNGIQGNSSSFFPSISADGRYIAFSSFASNLVPNDTNNNIGVFVSSTDNIDVFVRDTINNTTTLISLDSNGIQGNSASFSPSISADGRYVAFTSRASNLVPNDTNMREDVFVRDTVDNITTRVSVDPNGIQGNRYSFFPSISADGRYITFTLSASRFDTSDSNVFLVRNPLIPTADFGTLDLSNFNF
ncbi:TolB family protein [Iningainema tapete]|uniref:PD40 domain-containing protein n=1 Tax=Iningainema tapete BLCC-T55 TaxID=2748662 RepID=A0A8J6XIY6_9CYAN|nr:pre-peptidase C-terminal domain-containing protein [Iningainema tapete]MBD2772309.1 PD40 domain-containing protein [Iningainema tapete BLCC-T55]